MRGRYFLRNGEQKWWQHYIDPFPYSEDFNSSSTMEKVLLPSCIVSSIHSDIIETTQYILVEKDSYLILGMWICHRLRHLSWIHTDFYCTKFWWPAILSLTLLGWTSDSLGNCPFHLAFDVNFCQNILGPIFCATILSFWHCQNGHSIVCQCFSHNFMSIFAKNILGPLWILQCSGPNLRSLEQRLI